MQGNQNHRPSGPRPEWKEVKRFVDGQLVVVVSAVQSFRPRHSIQIGRLRDDGTVTSHMPVQVEGSLVIKVTPVAKTVLALLEQAEEWISTEFALRGNQDIEKRIEKETKQANFGKPETRVTGKTAKKKARKLGQVVA